MLRTSRPSLRLWWTVVALGGLATCSGLTPNLALAQANTLAPSAPSPAPKPDHQNPKAPGAPQGSSRTAPAYAVATPAQAAEALARDSLNRSKLVGAEAAAVTSKQPRAKLKLRRLRTREVSPEMRLTSRRLIQKHYAQPTGTEIRFQSGGKDYVARLERHFHPVGGSVGPWGYHPGISLFGVE